MKRILQILKRALTTTIHVALASLAIFWLVVWAASYRYCHDVYVGNDRGTHGWGVDIRTTPGALECVGITFESEPGRTAKGLSTHFAADAWTDVPNMIQHRDWVRYGFGMHRWQQLPLTNSTGPRYTNSYFGIAIPFWLLAMLCVLPPLLRYNPRRLRRRRLAAGLCPKCGYDLRATPGQCPECGTISQP